jgi:hypothetical protein
MDLTEGSETSANINQTLGIHPNVDTVNYQFQFVRRCITVILLSHLEILTQVHTRIVEKKMKYDI